MTASTGGIPHAMHPPGQPGVPAWNYEEAFVRNQGLIAPEEQQRLRTSRVAIAGMGGIGGLNLMTLVRLGVGRFSIADPGEFDTANTNRQYGAMVSTMGRSKVEVMAEIARDVNPQLDLRVFREPIGPKNTEEFLRDADLFIDALEVFEPDVRRALFRQAARQDIFGVGGGPVGFSGMCLVFDPRGLSYDRYFDFSDEMDILDKFIAFATGVAPKATQRSYMDMSYVDLQAHTAPSCSPACHLAAGAVGCEAVKILLKKGTVRAAPYYYQFDAFKGQFARGYLWLGNRHPVQRVKRWLLKRFLVARERDRKRNA